MCTLRDNNQAVHTLESVALQPAWQARACLRNTSVQNSLHTNLMTSSGSPRRARLAVYRSASCRPVLKPMQVPDTRISAIFNMQKLLHSFLMGLITLMAELVLFSSIC